MTPQTAARLSLPPLSPHIKVLTNHQAEQIDRLHPDNPKRLSDCITCRGTKTFLWYPPGSRSDPALYDCPCPDQYVLHRWLLLSGVAESYQKLSWDDYDMAPAQAIDAAMEYLENAEPYVDSGFGLILSGDRGTGKTMLGYLIIKDLIDHGVNCYATTFVNMIERFTAGWVAKEDKDSFNRQVRHARVLLVDDLGREHHKAENAVGRTMFESVIRDRINRGLPTFITTNMRLDEMRQGYGENTMSLLSERCEYVDMRGQDARVTVGQRFRAEIKAGLKRPIVTR